MSKRIAIWGYRDYGKWLYSNIIHEWKNEYKITAVFDKTLFGTETPDGMQVLDPNQIGRYYSEGLFDEVLPSVAKHAVRDVIVCELQMKGIPICILDNRAAFHPAVDFVRENTDIYQTAPSGYRVQSLHDMIFFPLSGRKCFLYDDKGNILADNWYDYEFIQEPLIYSFRPDRPVADVPEHDGDYCAITQCYADNYGHFIFQSMDQAWVLEKMGYRGKYIIPSNTAFAVPLMELIGIDRDRLIDFKTLGVQHASRLERLLLVTQTAGYYDPRASAPVLAEMAEHILANVDMNDEDKYPERVFIDRKYTRRLRNAQDILIKYGFTSIVPDDLSVMDQIRFFNKAKIVISPHGANSANSLFMHSGAVLIETFPNNLIQPACIETATARGIRYLQVTESRTQVLYSKPKDPLDYNADYEIDNSLFEQAICIAIMIAK